VCGHFLWDGSKEEVVFPWADWDKISHPKDWGGCGIKDLSTFATSLLAKIGVVVIINGKYVDESGENIEHSSNE